MAMNVCIHAMNKSKSTIFRPKRSEYMVVSCCVVRDLEEMQGTKRSYMGEERASRT